MKDSVKSKEGLRARGFTEVASVKLREDLRGEQEGTPWTELHATRTQRTHVKLRA